MSSIAVSSAQEAMWLEQNLAPDVPNNTTTIWVVRGELDLPVLEDAFRLALGESDPLLVNFRRKGDELRLVCRELGDWEPFRVDVSDAADPSSAARDLLAEEVRRPFDLGADLLFRIGTVRLGDGHHLICLILHHLVTDGYGVFALLSQRIAEVYRALRAGSPVPEKPRTPPGIDGEREAEYRSSGGFAEAEDFWRDYVAGDGRAARLPTGVRAVTTSRIDDSADDAGFWDCLTAPLGAASYTARIEAGEVARWDASGVAVPDLLTAATAAFLQRWCDVPKPLLSFSVNYRSGKIRQALGLYSNALPMAVDVAPAADLVELAGRVRAERLRVLEHAEYNVSLIKRAIGHAGDVRSPFGPLISVVSFLRELDLAGATGRFVGGTLGQTDDIRIAAFGDGGAHSDLYFRFDAPATMYSRE
ncbi:MAG TPA: condensation domain-containing protein, partial [Lentzea sp.]